MAQTLREARRRFFLESGFEADGGYADDWQDVAFGPVPYSVPNPPMRQEALRVHDLHHPLTGYDADWTGEAQISAWELGSGGGGRYPYAWFIALFGLLTGLIGLPRATWRAFRRGRQSRNLYGAADPLSRLERTVPAVREELGITAETSPSRPWDVARFAGWATLAGVLSVVFAMGIPFLVFAAALRAVAPCRLRCPLSAAVH